MPVIPTTHHDLLAAPGAAALATIGPDGRPQVTAVWFHYDGEQLRLSLNETRQKTRNLLARPEATLFFVDPTNPYRTLEVRAAASLQHDPDYACADQVGAKYGADLRRMDQPGERRYAVTLTPTRVNCTG
jgi:PPOX class probable F420-dependent enzyme